MPVTDNTYTIRIPKWLPGTIAALVLSGGAFTAGYFVAGGDDTTTIVLSDSTTSTVSATTTTPLETTTTAGVATTTTAKPAANGGGGNPAPAKLGATIAVSDNCPPEGLGNIVQGVLTVTWTSSKAVSRSMKVDHGSQQLMPWADPGSDSGKKTFGITCNNQVAAGGAKNGKPLTVLATLTVTGADGTSVTARAEGQT